MKSLKELWDYLRGITEVRVSAHTHVERVSDSDSANTSESISDRPLLVDDPSYRASRRQTDKLVAELNVTALLLRQEIDARAGRFDDADHPT
jgi:hypothetical protein